VRIIAISIVGVVAMAACGGGGKPAEDAAAPIDAGPADAATDAAPTAATQILMQTSGGGAMSSPAFRARLGVGAPQPQGVAASANHEVITGPAAARP